MQIFFFHSLHDIRSSLTPYRLNSHKYTFHLVSLSLFLFLPSILALQSVSHITLCRCRPLSSTRKHSVPAMHSQFYERIHFYYFSSSHDNYISLGFWFASKLIEFFFISYFHCFLRLTFYWLNVSPGTRKTLAARTHTLTCLLSPRYRSQQWNYSCNVTVRAHSHFFSSFLARLNRQWLHRRREIVICTEFQATESPESAHVYVKCISIEW